MTTVDKSRLFKRAWRIKREQELTFSIALKTSWSIEKGTTNMITEEKLEKAGGKLWEKAGMRRMYFNNLNDYIGLECNYYKTGNISSANLNGTSISNNKARGIKSQLYNGKVYFDLNNKEFGYKYINEELAEEVIEGIKASL